MRLFAFLFIFGALLTPQLALAGSAMPTFTGSIVPCGQETTCSTGEKAIKDCTFCDLIVLAQRIINFLIFAGVVIAVLMFVYAGVLYVSSPTNPGNISTAHRIFWDVLIGLIITLAAWLIVDVVITSLVPEGQGIKQYGPWNGIICGGANTEADSSNPRDTRCTCADGGVCTRIQLTPDELSVREVPGNIVQPANPNLGKPYCYYVTAPDDSKTPQCSTDRAACDAAQAEAAAGGESVGSCVFVDDNYDVGGNAGPATGAVAGNPNPEGVQTYSHNEALAVIGDDLCGASRNTNCIAIESTGSVQEECATMNGCTTLNGIKGEVIDWTKNLYDSCRSANQTTGETCRVGVIGAAEPHSAGTFSHGNGFKVDISKNQLRSSQATIDYIEKQYINNTEFIERGQIHIDNTSVGTRYSYYQSDGSLVRIIDESDHYDVQVIPAEYDPSIPGFER